MRHVGLREKGLVARADEARAHLPSMAVFRDGHRALRCATQSPPVRQHPDTGRLILVRVWYALSGL